MNDPLLPQLHRMTQNGCPKDKKKYYQAYKHTFRDELIVYDLKGNELVIPVAMQKEIMSIAHSGIEGCIRRLQDTHHFSKRISEV